MNFRGGPVEVDRLPRVAARGGCCLNGLPAVLYGYSYKEHEKVRVYITTRTICHLLIAI